MKYIVLLSLILILSGCTEKEAIHVDANGTQIKSYQQMKQQDIVCDSRGYAYYQYYFVGNSGSYNLTPMLENGDYGTYQILCKDL